MKKLMDKLLLKNVRLYIILAYFLVIIIGVGLAYYFMPILLNYAPYSINTEFDKQFSGGLTFSLEFIGILIGILLVVTIWLLIDMREFKNINSLKEESKSSREGYEKFLRVVQKCYTIPKQSFLLIAVVPSFVLSFVFIMLRFTSFADFKVLLVALSTSVLGGTFAFIISRRVFRNVLERLMNLKTLQRGKLKLTPSIMFQIIPIATICILYSFFITYSNGLESKSLLAQKHYTTIIENSISNYNCKNIKDIQNALASTPLLNSNDKIALIDGNRTVYTSKNVFTNVGVASPFIDYSLGNHCFFYDKNTNELFKYSFNNLDKLEVSGFRMVDSQKNTYEYRDGSLQTVYYPNKEKLPLVVFFDKKYIERNRIDDKSYTNVNLYLLDNNDNFFYTYATDISSKVNNRIYGYYGSEIQGALIPVTLNGEIISIAVMYDLSNGNISGVLLNLILILIISVFVTYRFAKSIARDVKLVTDGINSLLQGNAEGLNRNLPVTSNDELGELIIAFNKVQELTKENIIEIKSNEQMLMEKERLASLGELIGGIAHNMKTPIMSTAGAAEGLVDLITEYRASIDNPAVTPDDHKEIAKDMLEWVTKIKSYNSYMSDIITAVKGQASQLASNDNEKFTLYELSKRVEILIKHEIKKANLILNIDLKCDPSIYLTGDINNLVQVINNLISNSIYSYNGKPDQEVKYIIDANDNNIIMQIVDHGCGMNEETKSKLFKQMYTTKGKNGTGLGLYMSYSTIRGKFSGNMTFESQEGEGTTFTITIPRKS